MPTPTANVRAASTSAKKAINQTANKAENGAAKLTRKAEDMIHEAGGALYDQIEHVREKASVYTQVAADKVVHAQETVTEQVRKHPLAGLSIAAGVGVVLGLLLRGRRH